jgi:hypothetical protein
MKLSEELCILSKGSGYHHIDEFKSYVEDICSDADYQRYLSYYSAFMSNIGNYSYEEVSNNTDKLTRIEVDYCYLFSKYQNALWECSYTNVPHVQSFFYEIGDYVQMELEKYISRIKVLQESKKRGKGK